MGKLVPINLLSHVATISVLKQSPKNATMYLYSLRIKRALYNVMLAGNAKK